MAANRWRGHAPRAATWTIVLASCVALVFLTDIAAVSLSLEDIPAYPGATLRQSVLRSPEHLEAEFWLLLPEDASHEQVGAEARNAAEKSVELMKQSGWALTRENRQRRGGEFFFRKETIKTAKLVVAARGKPMEGKMRNYVGLSFELRRLIPFEDVIGPDSTDVPRYPGSMRVKWMNLLGDYSAKYLVVGSEAEVKAFFEESLPEHGWTPGRGAGDLNYAKGAASAEELRREAKPGGDPVAVAKSAIPTTLSVHLAEEDGIVQIGIGRSAGAGDTGESAAGDLTPDEQTPRERGDILTSIDVDRDLPVYPALELESRWNDPIGLAGEEIIKLRYVKAEAEMAEALEMATFYLEQMQEREWTLEDDEWYGIGRTLLFRKGAVKSRIAIKAVGRYPIPENARPINIPVEVDVTLPMPDEDVAGEDIDGVPRFEGSRRFYYLKAGIDHIAKFKAVATVSEVEWFFVRQLPGSGWAFAGNDSTGLLFVPAGTATSAAGALASGKLIPTTLKIKVDDMLDGSVKIGMDLTKGD